MSETTPAPPALIEVAVAVPLPTFFTYLAPPGPPVPAGVRVRVPFGTRKLVGITFGPGQPDAALRHTLRPIQKVLDLAPVIDARGLALARWLADYWFAPPGEAVNLLLPPRMADGEDAPKERLTRFIRRLSGEAPRSGAKMREVLAWLDKNGDASADTVRGATGVAHSTLRRMVELRLIAVDETTQNRDPLAGISLASLKSAGGVHPLTAAQREAADQVYAAFGTYRGFLLHGVTGSGKTEVYLDLIERALSRGQGSLVLVPEIALTPQLVARFRARLGERVAVQHSGLDPSARHEQWLRIRAGELPVVVGARSALFSPIRELGLVIVDEEHEASFKQETSPRYHARDLALVLGHLAKCPVVLGSATPSLESWANVARKKLTRLSLPERAHQLRPLPEVSLVDMREAHDGRRGSNDSPFSPRLIEALGETLTAGDQALIFLNRRGYASFVQCRTCGKTLDCASCSVTFTWHRRRQRLVCHYCDASRPMPPSCPSCRKNDLVELGHGTEQLEERLAELLPNAKIGRMDRDTTRGKALVKLLSRFRNGELDVLIGTQMLAKGHDFPGVTLVGVLSAEHGLAFPDPRAAERTFQLLTQIAGRAGRGERPGRVIIQTRMPEHYAIARAVQHDVEGFLDTEMALREARGFPPQSHLALFRLSGKDVTQTETLGQSLADELRQHLGPNTSVTGPQPAPIERVKDRFRFQVLVRAKERRDLRRTLDLSRAFWSARQPGDLQIALDVDPHNFL